MDEIVHFIAKFNNLNNEEKKREQTLLILSIL